MTLGNPFQEPVLHISDSAIFFKEIIFQFRKKKWRTRFLNENLRVLQASYVIKNTSLQRSFTLKKGTKVVIFISLKIFPKPAKMLPMSCNVNFS